jgi:hypothetical protein
MKKPKTIPEMLAFLAGLRKRSNADLKRNETELRKYDSLLKKEKAIVEELEPKYKLKLKIESDQLHRKGIVFDKKLERSIKDQRDYGKALAINKGVEGI